MRTTATGTKLMATVRRAAAFVVAAGCVALVALVGARDVDAAPVERAGHHRMAWTVTDAAGGHPPNSFGGGGAGRWGGADGIWSQPGFTGSYRITVDGTVVAGYCADFHNAKSPDAASAWTADRSAFLGSDKALTKLSYALWRWGDTTDADTGAALNLYTHFLGSPGDRSNRSGVPIPDINDNDVLDEVVTTLAPHTAVASIMYSIDAQAEAWSAAFSHRPAHVRAGVEISLDGTTTVVTSSATGRSLPAASYELARAGRRVTVTTAGTAQPIRDVTAGSQNSVTAGTPQTAVHDIVPDVTVASQISDAAPELGTMLSDEIIVAGLLDGESATVSVELFDLTDDPNGKGKALATETRSGLANGASDGWAPYDVRVAVAGHRLGYRHRLESIDPHPAAGTLPGEWSELGIASETGTAADVTADVHIRKTVASSSQPDWINAQRDTAPMHGPAPAPEVAADGSHDDQAADDGDGLPIYLAGDEVTFRYEVWLDPSSTGQVDWTGDPITDDNGTPDDSDDDHSPLYADGDDGDGHLSPGEVWIFESTVRRVAEAGEHHVNIAAVEPGAVLHPTTGEPNGDVTTRRQDRAGYIVPCLSTAVAERTDDSPVVDTATFCNLIRGESYLIEGIVVDAGGTPTGHGGSTTFVATETDGAVDVEIPLDTSLASGDYVVFETIIAVRTGDIVAVHADLDDVAQTFTILPPEPPIPPVTTIPTPTTPTTTTTTVPPSTTTPPTSTVPPTVVTVPPTSPPASPPSIPKAGTDAAHLAALAGIALLTAGIVLMEARHGRIRRPSESA